MSKEIISKLTMTLLKKSFEFDTRSNVPGGTLIDDGFLYYSFRPLWVDLIHQIGQESDLISCQSGGAFIRVSNPLSLKLIRKNEILAANTNSINSSVSDFIQESGALVLLHEEYNERVVVLDINKKFIINKYRKQPGDGKLEEIETRRHNYHGVGDKLYIEGIKELSNIIKSGFYRDVSWHQSLYSRLDESRHCDVLVTRLLHATQTGKRLSNVIQDDFDEYHTQIKKLSSLWRGSANAFGYTDIEVDAHLAELTEFFKKGDAEKENKQTKIVKWVDLDSFGIYLGEQRFSDGIDRLMLVDINDYINKNNCAQQLKDIGFVKMKGQPRFDGGMYVLNNPVQQLKPSYLAKALNLEKCPLKDIDVEQIPLIFKEKVFERFEININKYALQSDYLGMNSSGNKVFRGSLGRFIRNSPHSTKQYDAVSTNPDFLIAKNSAELRLCAEGFVREIIAGERKKWGDVVFFTRVVLDMDEPDDNMLHSIQEAIEAAAYRLFTTEFKHASIDDAYKVAQSIYYGLPVARVRTAQSINFQQFSTPLPISVVAQRLLTGHDKNQEEKIILEPTGGNGGLLFKLSGHKSIVELDPERFSALKEAHPDAVVINADATAVKFRSAFNRPDGFDYVIANPPFGQMEVKPFLPLPKVGRLDHYIALRALESRKEKGRAVIIIGADNAQSDGEIKGRTKAFLNYIHDYYEVHGITEIDGRLYARQGSAYNIRFLVVGDRKPVPTETPVPEKLPVLHSYDEVWQWADICIAGYNYADSNEFDNTALSTKTQDSVAANEAGARSSMRGSVKTAPAPVRYVNEFQAPYKPLSKNGMPSTMIPINLSGAIYSALTKLKSRVGDIDQYVAQRLNYTDAELLRYFSPEQVDAIGLGICAIEDGRGMINADQTGIGKGRFVAAMLRYARLNNKLPVFLTIKPELFTDIFRDIRDIGSEDLFQNTFIFNDKVDVKVYGSETEVLRPATPAIELKAAFDQGKVESTTELVMATYSQFQRERSKNKKSELILSITDENTMLLLDESHIAAGDSQISEIVSDCVGLSGGVIYASATPIKGVRNFSLYSKCFPESVDTVNLPATLALGGEALQEAISTNMALDGAIIRREHDYSNLTFITKFPDPAQEAKNRELMDQVADVISDMSYLSGDVRKKVKDINQEEKDDWESIPENLRKGSRLNASSMNFGSRLYSITRQFLLGIKTASVIEDALAALNEGRKPVIAVENTGESLLKQLIVIKSNTGDMEDELEFLNSKGKLQPEESERKNELQRLISAAQENVIFDTTPQFRELLEIMLDRMAQIKIVGRYGDVKTINATDDEDYLDAQEALRDKIRNLPDLSISPIDEFKFSLHTLGYRVAEVSGRKTSLLPVNTDHGIVWRVQTHTKADAVANVAAFQNGKMDAIVITRSGSTGISLHATDRFEDSDTRQRQFIAWQKAANIAEFLQWMGRVNRKDQVCSPIISNVESGLPAESRQTMMHNAKLRKLSANTTSNRENENLEGDIDLLNNVGDEVALAFLRANPDIAGNLDISLPKEGEQANSMSENPFINKLMGRLMMIPVSQQEMILDTLVERFRDKVEELEHANKNPFKISVFDWNARIIHEEELMSGNINSSDSSFDEPVKLVTLEYEKIITPMRYSQVVKLIENNSKAIYKSGGRTEKASNDPDVFLNLKTQFLKDNQLDFVKNFLPAKIKKSISSVIEIKGMDNVNGALEAINISDYLIDKIKYMKLGRQIEIKDHETGELLRAVIVNIEFPKNSNSVFYLSKYRFYFAIPGKEAPVEISLAALRANDVEFDIQKSVTIDPNKNLDDYLFYERRQLQSTIDLFDNAEGGKLVLRRHTLEGNIYRASEIAAQQNIGYPVLYTDNNRNRQRAILIKAAVKPDDLRNLPLSMTSSDASRYVDEWLSKYKDKNTATLVLSNTTFDDDDGEDYISLCYVRNGGVGYFRLKTNGSKGSNSGFIVNSDIFDTGGVSEQGSLKIKLAGNRKTMQAIVPVSLLPELLVRIEKGHHAGKFYIKNPDKELMGDIKERNKISKYSGVNKIDETLDYAS